MTILIHKISTVQLLAALVPAIGLLTAVSAMGQTTAIQKCQDAEGNWHYGDQAAEACARSEIEKLDRVTGVRVGTTAPPPTSEELTAQREAESRAAEAEQERLDRRLDEDRLLATYDNEQQIIDARERHLSGIDNEITVHGELIRHYEDLLKGVEQQLSDPALTDEARQLLEQQAQTTRRQIGYYRDYTEAKVKEKQEVEQRYAKDLEYYREILSRRGINPS